MYGRLAKDHFRGSLQIQAVSHIVLNITLKELCPLYSKTVGVNEALKVKATLYSGDWR